MENQVNFIPVETEIGVYFRKLEVETGFIYYMRDEQKENYHPQGTFVPKETIFKRLRYDG